MTTAGPQTKYAIGPVSSDEGVDSGLTERSVPRPVTDAAMLRVGDSTILASEHGLSPTLLDPVSAEIWRFLDGKTALGDIVTDLVEVFGGAAEWHWRKLCELVQRLTGSGLLENPCETATIPRRFYPNLDADSCLGRRLGLGNAHTLQIAPPTGPQFRIRSTDPATLKVLLARLPAEASVVPEDASLIETIVARFSDGRVPRLQQVFGPFGNLIFATRDLDVARLAVESVVAGLLDEARNQEPVFAQSPALITSDAIVLLHPALAAQATRDLRLSILQAGIEFVPGYLIELTHNQGVLEARIPDLRSGERRRVRTHPVAAIAIVVDPQAPSNRPLHTLNLAHLLRRWDQTHLDALPMMARVTPAEVPPELSIDEATRILSNAARGS